MVPFKLQNELQELKEKINMDVSVCDKKKNFFSTDPKKTLEEIPAFENKIFVDEFNAKTYFVFTYLGTQYHGWLDGSSKMEEGYASLLITILDSEVLPKGVSSDLPQIVRGNVAIPQVEEFIRVNHIPFASCTAVVIKPIGRKSADMTEFLENFKMGENDLVCSMGQTHYVMVIFFEESTEDDFKTLTDFSNLLVRSIDEELGSKVIVGIGNTVDNFMNCHQSYAQAMEALKYARDFSSKIAVCSYREFFIVRLLKELPKSKVNEYLSSLVQMDTIAFLKDEELVDTAVAFLDNNLNVSETAKRIFIHRNTLIYRLDKISRMTGLDIRKFQDAFIFRMIYILYSIGGYYES